MKKLLLKRWLFILPGIVAYILSTYAQNHMEWTEQYSRSIYPMLANTVGFLPSLAKGSVSECLLVIALLGLILWFIHYVQMLHKNEGARGMIVYRGIVGIIAIGSIVYFAFTLLNGLNYYRRPFLSYVSYHEEKHSEEELEALCQSLANDMNLIRKEIGEERDISTSNPEKFEYYNQHAVLSIALLSKKYPILKKPLYAALKPVKMSKLMSYAGIYGNACPFTLEANINVEVPEFLVPSTMVHELAHQCGFMHEDEANFIAYLACKQQDELVVSYSGDFLAFDYAIAALEEVDLQKATAVKASLSQSVQIDRLQRERYSRRYKGVITTLSSTVNNAYLKANNQTDGVNSYNKMVNLLLAKKQEK